MSQSASGTGNIQVSVAASQNVTIVVNGQTVVELESRDFPQKLPTKTRREIDLLKAPFAQTPLIGRNADLDSFVNWCLAKKESLLMRTVVGRGGSGKTRFAYELYARIRQQPGWDAYFLRFNTNEVKGVNLWKEIKSKNALIIADYASDDARPLADLLRTLARFSPASEQRIRVLLLARTASWDQGWLADLSSERTGENVRECFDPQEPIELLALVPEGRREVFNKTVAIAAEYMSKPLPPPLPLEQFQNPDVAERLADPLTLMMAALMAVESSPASALALNRTRLAHEVAEKLVGERMKDAVEHHQELFLHLAAYATLCGGLQEEEALEALEEESKQTRLGSVADPSVFLSKLQGWLPGEKTKSWIGVIEPDIVGEAFVLGQHPKIYLRNADVAVLRAAARHSSSIVQTIVRMAQDFSFSEAEERIEPLEWLMKLVERGEADEDLNFLFYLSVAIPESTVVLREIGLHISTVLCSRLRKLFVKNNAALSQNNQSFFAASLNNLAARQRDVGQLEAALETAEEATAYYRELLVRDRAAFLSKFAMSLDNLAVMKSDAGRLESALQAAEEATAYYRELLERDRTAFLADCAMSINNLAKVQNALGNLEAALATIQEAVDLFRELAAGNRSRFLAFLAGSINNLANAQKDAGQREKALMTAGEATVYYRELVQRKTDAFLPDLAMALINLAGRQRDAGQKETALTTMEEATVYYRELVRRNRAAFLPNLALSLNNLAILKAKPEALMMAEEATGYFRELVGRNRNAFLPGLAMALSTLAYLQSNVGELSALATAEEATACYRELALGNRDAFLADLAGVLGTLSYVRTNTGQHEASLVAVEEALGYYRELVERNRDAYFDRFTKMCGTLGQILSVLDRHSEAIKAFAEGISSILREVRTYPASNKDLLLVLLRDYVSSVEMARVEPDTALLVEAIAVLGGKIRSMP